MLNRIRILINGAVQGVGFRPFIFNLAQKLNITGFIKNTTAGVVIEAEGLKNDLDKFLELIKNEKPKNAIIENINYFFITPLNTKNFFISRSTSDTDVSTIILPDLAICEDCKNEFFDINNRRYLYPFINCINCGPRFTIIERLPYDRQNTSMKIFEMCSDCRGEYTDPKNRRFHAQPISCYNCGPKIILYDNNQNFISENQTAIDETINLINEGKIIALKGVGGYHLIADATNSETIKTLRLRKTRPNKAFAIMFNSIVEIEKVCFVNEKEKELLTSSASPIVLLKKKINGLNDNFISTFVAPDNPFLGVMLPYNPLHLLIITKLKKPIIATSANLSDETIITDEKTAFEKLKDIADYFLTHNRKIIRHCDDSIVKVFQSTPIIFRRARGYSSIPMSIDKPLNSEENFIALGGNQKNTICILKDNQIITSQHIGDISTIESFNAFKSTINDLKEVYNFNTDLVIVDKHPEYLTTKFGLENFSQLDSIQHHIAHIASCRLEHRIKGIALGVSWDGTGYDDGIIRGGEFFISDDFEYKHIGNFEQFILVGGDKSIYEPQVISTSLIYSLLTDKEKTIKLCKKFFNEKQSIKKLEIILKQIDANFNCFPSTSIGRVFDAVSSILGLNQVMTFEGQAASLLEYTAIDAHNEVFDYEIKNFNNKFSININKILRNILEEISFYIEKSSYWNNNYKLFYDDIILDNEEKLLKKKISYLSTKFHNTLADIIYQITIKNNFKQVILSGGCFQNHKLLEKTLEKLHNENIKVFFNSQIPTNDGGISCGQIFAYIQKKMKEEK